MKILVISDIHGNAEALRAVMDAEQDADHVIFLGDALLSGPQPNETAELLASLDPDICIIGNHDEEVLDPSEYQHFPAEWVALNDWLVERIPPEAVEFLKTFKPAGQYQLAGLDMYLHHGQIDKDLGAAWPDQPDECFLSMDSGSGSPFVLFGHTHVQFERRIGNTRYINPGSVGQPRCGRLHACYGVFLDGHYTPRQVTYDPAPWLAAIEKVAALDAYPEFRQWHIDGLLNGFGVGEREPWVRYAAEGYC